METNENEYKIDGPKWGNKQILLLALALVVLVILSLAVYYFTKVNQAYSLNSREVSFSIAKGETTRSIANALGEQKIISSPWLFIIYTETHGAGSKIEAGDYALNANMPITEIVDILTHGRVVSEERTLTTIEGWTNLQLAEFLADRQVVSSTQDFSNVIAGSNFTFKFNDQAKKFNYQGFLFPDTYIINNGQGADVLVQKMLNNFQAKLTDQMLTDIAAQHRNLTDVIILASIIEKEVGRNKTNLTQTDLDQEQIERTQVASVFYNRLAIGMPLESDATVNYITGKSDRSVTTADTKIQSPYNTYQVKGLPPGPISNPGLGSILAAIYPATTDYLYFLNTPDGTAVFAKTLAQHNANKAKYLK